MKLMVFIVLLFVGLAPGSQLVLLAGEPCLQQYDFRAYCPHVGAMTEPNAPGGASNLEIPILMPMPSTDLNIDPNALATWERPVGRWYREAPVCLPTPGWSLDSIVFVDGTNLPTVTMDTAGMTWGLATDVRQGANWWAIRATSRNVADPSLTQSRVIFVTCLGILNDHDAAPILAAIQQFLEVG